MNRKMQSRKNNCVLRVNPRSQLSLAQHVNKIMDS